jgi:hypothetical protein
MCPWNISFQVQFLVNSTGSPLGVHWESTRSMDVRFLVEWHSWRNPRNPLGLPGFQWDSSGMCGGVKSLVQKGCQQTAGWSPGSLLACTGIMFKFSALCIMTRAGLTHGLVDGTRGAIVILDCQMNMCSSDSESLEV